MKVVAWYLPSFAAPKKDLPLAGGDQLPHAERRAVRLLRARHRGERRQERQPAEQAAADAVVAHSRQRRPRVRAGRDHPLTARDAAGQGLLGEVPYADLGLTYDVFLPMGYFSYRPTDLGGAYGYTVRNVALIRRGTGNPQVAIHAIGGVDDVSAAQVDAFVRATRVCGVAGASLYDFTTTVPGGWKYLRAVRLKPPASTSRCL